MNLLSLLLKSLLSDSSLTQLIKKTGLTEAALKKLLPLAIPLLIKALTSNASSQTGLASLLGALTQHTSTKSMDLQLEEADNEDGAKIVRHIFGDESDANIDDLARQSGLSSMQVSSVLSEIAPALMSSLSAANSSAAASAASASPFSALGSLFGSFLGQQPDDDDEPDQSLNGMQLLSLLGGFGGLR